MRFRKATCYPMLILLGSMLGMGLGVGLVYYAFSILVGPLQEKFGWESSQIMDAPLIWVFVMALTLVPVGKVNDRYGPRFVMSAGALLAAAGLVGLGFMQTLWHFRLANAVLAFGMTGVSQPVCMGAVARWFYKYRGWALGCTIAGGAVGAFAASRLWPILLRSYGIRGVYLACAGFATFVLFPYVLAFMRRAPEDYGLRPFGATETPADTRKAPAREQEGLTSVEARHTANYWLIMVYTLCANLAYNAVAMHFVPIFESGGLSREAASHMLGYTILLSFVGKVTGGLIADYVNTKRFLALAHVGYTAASASLLFAGAEWQLAFFVVVWGLSLGFSAGAYGALAPELFGTRELSTILSQFFILQVIGSGVGPKISAYIYDTTQSYAVAYMLAAGLYAVTVVLALLVQPRFLGPTKRRRAAQPDTVALESQTAASRQ